MKTVGIITFHNTINYGGILQTYALQKVIREMGYDVENINYVNNEKTYAKYSKKRRILQYIWRNIFCPLFGGAERKKKTNEFREKYIKLSKNVHSIDGIVHPSVIYDMYITGSDQVWNFHLTGNDSAYFLDFAPREKKRVSYAASFGFSQLPDNQKERYSELISKFDALSVREIQGKEIINSLLKNKQVSVVLDPTLLLDKKEWAELLGNTEVCNEEGYILCYYMPGDKVLTDGIKAIADKLSRRTGKKVINIGKKEYNKLMFWEVNLTSEGPLEFINLFKNASYIVTNSFHGTAFSIIFKKEFFIPENKKMTGVKQLNSRIISLLSILELSNRLVPVDQIKNTAYDKFSEIDYKNVYSLLNVEKDNSLKFLTTILKEEQQ
ncbi:MULTISPECIES: polysaccharide pyruvyl transferase family protein [unclassified Sporosarcina]|uniref:polysaccharide pyruvyl transferase family protein n=1 Tax=unclassified Sporosarcina TaxID=2647733 RepID=UPI0013047416|nr:MULTISPECIES: polysaccharide pyruvyl transferase family protein [unclassified Sporosarcina]